MLGNYPETVVMQLKTFKLTKQVSIKRLYVFYTLNLLLHFLKLCRKLQLTNQIIVKKMGGGGYQTHFKLRITKKIRAFDKLCCCYGNLYAKEMIITYLPVIGHYTGVLATICEISFCHNIDILECTYH